MISVLVWLLVVTSHSGANVVVLERFAESVQCQHVRNNIPDLRYVEARCIQATILVEKK